MIGFTTSKDITPANIFDYMDDLYELTLRVDEIQLKLNSVINMFNGNVIKNVNAIVMNGENK